jgi:hypothetical protein
VFSGNTYANFKILDGLEFTSTLGVNIGNNNNPYFKSTKSDLQGGLGKNYSRITSSEANFWQWSNRINYTKKIGNDHALNVLLGTEVQKSNSLILERVQLLWLQVLQQEHTRCSRILAE